MQQRNEFPNNDSYEKNSEVSSRNKALQFSDEPCSQEIIFDPTVQEFGIAIFCFAKGFDVSVWQINKQNSRHLTYVYFNDRACFMFFLSMHFC